MDNGRHSLNRRKELSRLALSDCASAWTESAIASTTTKAWRLMDMVFHPVGGYRNVPYEHLQFRFRMFMTL